MYDGRSLIGLSIYPGEEIVEGSVVYMGNTYGKMSEKHKVIQP